MSDGSGGGGPAGEEPDTDEDRSSEPDRSDDDPTAALTHTDAGGDAQMVDVGGKTPRNRRAVARGELELQPETVAAIRADEVGKGDVLAVARVGAVQAVKRTWEAVPMCHQIPVTDVETDFALAEDRVSLAVTVETTARTGPEMEALQGVTTGLNVVWDMVKSAEKGEDGQYPETRLTDVRVVEKHKGTEG